MKSIIAKSPQETIELAQKIAHQLKGGEILALTGELGSGKTTFIKGLAEGLKVAEVITSPTFVMLKSFPAKIQEKKIEFVHVDAYRVETIEDIKSVGIEDYFEQSEKQGSAEAGSYFGRDDVIIAIEWAEKIKEILPKKIINIKFDIIDENSRRISTLIARA